MKNNIDAFMLENHVDVLLVTGPAQHNPAMFYFTGGGHVSMADLIKERGKDPVLFHASMEREEAARTGLKTISYDRYDFRYLLKKANGDRLQATALRYVKMFEDLGITSGRVALYGQVELGGAYALYNALQKLMPDLEFVGLVPDRILMPAMMTKDEKEIERMRRMGKITTEVVRKVAEYITSHKVEGDTLMTPEGKPLTIKDVKAKIDLWLAEGGAENPEGTIFAIGHDAGVPHSTGTPTDTLRLGQTIVFDIYPCETGGGYFYDFTRTWCLGYAPEAAQKLYDDVYSVYQKLYDELKLNEPFTTYQKRTCEMFEAMGHPTVMTKADTEEGYVHSLGHGVGLRVHEKPFSGMITSENDDNLVSGSVFTLEPGLYYPNRGLGVRLEDTYYVTPDGKFEVLADYPLDLILPMKG